MSVAHTSRKELQAQGEYVKQANTGWLAIYPKKLSKLLSANRDANLVYYRNNSPNPRDHYVIPLKAMKHMLTDESLGNIKNGGERWNVAIQGDQLRVTNCPEKMRISQYFGLPLKTEQTAFSTNFQIPEEEASYSEGRTSKIVVNRYERDPKAREACIRINGSS